MIDALSGGSEAKRNDDGLSDASDSEDKGASEFAKNVINKMNNAAGNGNGGGGGVIRRRMPMMQGEEKFGGDTCPAPDDQSASSEGLPFEISPQ
jgi:hypothetical protein